MSRKAKTMKRPAARPARVEATNVTELRPAKRPKQEHLPTLEPPSIKALDEAIDAYQEVKLARVALSAKEMVAREAVATIMRDHKLNLYKTSDGNLLASFEEKCKVKRAKDDDGGDSDEPDPA